MMKWWGWGDRDITFPMHEKPVLWPWIKGKLGLTDEQRVTAPIARAAINLPSVQKNEAFLALLAAILRPDQYSSDDDQRLDHCYGKSYPNLFMARTGRFDFAPDLIVWPESHADVEALVALADAHGVSIIPFGGGTNIVGGVDPLGEAKRRMILTLNMGRMNKLIALDSYSNTATIEAGALGPKLEKDLAEKGFALGHHPDSFEYSTLGGWLATRSAGMQSDEYGKIEDMVVSMRMVTPRGTITTKSTPASSAGPSLNQMMVGSEGVLGVITEATMRVHPVPAVKDYRGFLFPNFASGTAAIHECLERGFVPSMIRLQDEGETELAFNMKAPKKGLTGLVQKVIKRHLKAKGYTTPCIMVIGFEGTEEAVSSSRKGALAIMKKHRGFSLGKSIGKTWSKDKYNMPYLRDYIMDYSCMCDVAETATTWNRVLTLHQETVKAIRQKFASEEGGFGYLGCHISHTYKTGACLYFTWAVKQQDGRELEQYYTYKKMITDVFMRCEATLTHHHAVGYEHLPWMEQEVTPTGLRALRALKESLDPNGILNPGKLIPEEPTTDILTRQGAVGRAPALRESKTSDSDSYVVTPELIAESIDL